MYLSVGDGGEPASDFTIDSLQASRSADDTPVVLARVHNTGGRALDISGSLNLDNGPGGLRAGPFEAKLGTTLGIGQSEPVTVPLDKQVPDGPWDAKITLRSGLIERSAQATISFPAHGPRSAPPVAARPLSTGRKTLAALLMLVIASSLFVLLLFFVRQRRREEQYA
jgi:hypothetical protein